jgi:multidrug efflux system outer membrane protein
MNYSTTLILIPTTLLIVSCSSFKQSGSDYAQPKFQPAANYKSTTSSQLDVSSQWWKTFKDSKLNSLQSELIAQNLNLAAAYTRRQQALARLGIANSNRFPQLNATGGGSRERASQNGQASNLFDAYFNQYNVGANLSYELDLWGRVRDLVRAGKADAEAANFAIADVRVTLQTQLARQYFALRFLDSEMVTLESAVNTRQENVKITTERLEQGLTSELDSARATAELANAQAELLSLKGPRAQLENSIAVLLGRQASTFRISPRDYTGNLPHIPAGLPAALLYRRPDLAVAERKVAVATAQIGVAEKDRYPKISLTGSAGFNSVSSSNLLQWSSSFFAVGPSVSVPIFQGRRIKSNILHTKAQRAEALINYQQTALAAIADVESAIANLSALREETTARKASVDAASRTYELSILRYKEGVTSYLDVADAERERLTAERAAVRTRGQQFAATIQLIQSLGGGFETNSK